MADNYFDEFLSVAVILILIRTICLSLINLNILTTRLVWNQRRMN